MPGWPFRWRLGGAGASVGRRDNLPAVRRECQLAGRELGHAHETAQPFLPLRSSTQRPWSRSSAPSRRSGPPWSPLTEMPALLELAAGVALRARPGRRARARHEVDAGAERLAGRERRWPGPPRPPRPGRPARPRRGSPPNSTVGGLLGRRRGLGAVDQRVTSRPAPAGPRRRPGPRRASATTAVDLVHRQQRELGQHPGSSASSVCIQCWKNAYGRRAAPGRATPGRRWSCRSWSRRRR